MAMKTLCNAMRSFYISKSWLCDIIGSEETYTNAFTTTFVTISPIRHRRLLMASNQGIPRRRDFEILVTYTSPKILDDDSSGYLNWIETVESVVINEMLGNVSVQSAFGDIDDIDVVYISEEKEHDVWIAEITIRGSLSVSSSIDLKI